MGSLSQIASVYREESGNSIAADDEGGMMNTGSGKSPVSYETMSGVRNEI